MWTGMRTEEPRVDARRAELRRLALPILRDLWRATAHAHLEDLVGADVFRGDELAARCAREIEQNHLKATADSCRQGKKYRGL